MLKNDVPSPIARISPRARFLFQEREKEREVKGKNNRNHETIYRSSKCTYKLQRENFKRERQIARTSLTLVSFFFPVVVIYQNRVGRWGVFEREEEKLSM